jgi:hypothetical protein
MTDQNISKKYVQGMQGYIAARGFKVELLKSVSTCFFNYAEFGSLDRFRILATSGGCQVLQINVCPY